MHLNRSGISEHLDYVRTGRAADYRVINEHNALAANRGADWIELDSDRLFPLRLSLLNKGSADIAVFYKTGFKRYSRFIGIPYGSVYAGVRNTYYNIRLNRILTGKHRSRAHTGNMHSRTVKHGIRTRKIHMFKNFFPQNLWNTNGNILFIMNDFPQILFFLCV